MATAPSELVTNRHVVEGAKRLTIETTSGDMDSVKSWAVSRTDDLAVLELSKPVFKRPVVIAPQPAIPGDLLAVMGFPLGGPFTTGRGRVIDLDGRPGSHSEVIEASVDVLPGNSGGPLLNTSGQLVGLVRAIDLNNGSALAIPKERVEAMLAGHNSETAHPCGKRR